jgi:hypothetical protein
LVAFALLATLPPSVRFLSQLFSEIGRRARNETPNQHELIVAKAGIKIGNEFDNGKRYFEEVEAERLFSAANSSCDFHHMIKFSWGPE